MKQIRVSDFSEWRSVAREMLLGQMDPDAVRFGDPGEPMQDSLVESAILVLPPVSVRVPQAFLRLAEVVACHRSTERWNLLYRLVWRITRGESFLLEDAADPDVRQARLMEKEIRRDIHKMHAFVRFRETGMHEFVAWHRPMHRVVRQAAPFFARRFASMTWCILTPDECAYWDKKELRFGPGLPRPDDPGEDETEDLWLTYYASIFNPARLKIAAMTNELPVWHWGTLPESKLISGLIREAHSRVGVMVAEQHGSAQSFVPVGGSLRVLAKAASVCEGCDLFERATQTVFGSGPADARLMLVGEQPGDREDIEGAPFVGPAGKLLDEAIKAAGLVREEIYLTNAVKHFSFVERGKRRLHQKPKGFEISACRPWLEEEIRAVDPKVIVGLGATAARSLLGREVRLMEERGKWITNRFQRKLLVTLHPSAILRGSAEIQEHGFAHLVADLLMASHGKLEAAV